MTVRYLLNASPSGTFGILGPVYLLAQLEEGGRGVLSGPWPRLSQRKNLSLYLYIYTEYMIYIYIYRILYNYIVQYMYIYTSVYYYPVVSELMATAMCGTSAYKWNSTDELWDQDALESQRLAAEHKRFEEGGIAGEEVWSVDTLSFLPHIVRVKSRKLASAS